MVFKLSKFDKFTIILSMKKCVNNYEKLIKENSVFLKCIYAKNTNC